MQAGHYISEKAREQGIVPDLLSSMYQGIALTDRDLNILVFNRRAKELLDLPESLFSGTPNLADIIRFNAERGEYGPGDIEEQVSVRVAAALAQDPVDIERRVSGDRVLRIQETALPAGGFVTVYTDVTHERAVEARLAKSQNELETNLQGRTRELQESRDLLSSAVDAIPDALVMIDGDGALTLANSNMKRLFPLIECHVEAHEKITDAFPFEDGKVEDLAAFFNHIASQSDHRMFNSWFRIQVSSVPTGGHIVVFSDVSDFKKQNATLRAHADQLVKHLRKEKRLNEMQRQFVTMASHEFRTPLAIIDGAAQRLKRRIDRLDPTDVSERIERIRDAVGRMNYLIERFIDFAVAQDGTLEINPTANALVPIVQNVCAQQDAVHRSHRIELVEDVGDLEINIDRRMIEQCLVNIIGNAVKYSPGKDCVLVEVTTEGKYACVRVRDYGVGIPKRELSKVFGRFYRASTSSGIPGTGIGLNLAEMIVNRHKGRISAQSTVGEGTTILLQLPLEAAGSRPARSKAESVEAPAEMMAAPAEEVKARPLGLVG